MNESLRKLLATARVAASADRGQAMQLALFTVGNQVANPLRAIWFKLLIDAIAMGHTTSPVVYAVLLSLSDGLRSWALLSANMVKLDLQDRALFTFQREAMRIAGDARRIDHHERPEYADRLAVVRTNLPVLAGSFGSLVDLTAVVVRILVTLAILAFLQPVLVLLPLFAAPSILGGRRAEAINQRASMAAASARRTGEHLDGVLTSSAASKEVRIFGLRPELARRIRDSWRHADRIQLGGQLRTEGVKYLGWAVFGLAYAGGVTLIALRAISGSASAGDLVLAVVLGAQVNVQVAAAATLIGTATSLSSVVDHREWLRAYGAEGGDEPSRAPAPPARLASGIALRGVRFAYPGGGPVVLDGVDLELPAGTTAAIVGETGAGKTTLVKLLTGMYRPDQGSVLVDGVDLAEIDLVEWRRRVTCVFQDHMRFEFPLQHGVGVGWLPDVDDRRSVLAALEGANASDLDGALPHGLDTLVGLSFGGRDLSSGQWQKIAVARALMRSRPLLQILDEPTASLDAATEHALFEQYAVASRSLAAETGGITLFISHRYSTVRMADTIVVVRDGRIVEQGTHRTLLRSGGMYAELYQMHAAGYR